MNIRAVAALLLPALLVNTVILLIANPAPVFASTCGSGYYYAGLNDGDTSSAYGVGSHTTPYIWEMNSPNSYGHMLMYVDFDYNSNNWVQAGYGQGYIDGATATSRLVYMEFNVGGTISYYLSTGYTIPNNDAGYSEAWTYSLDGGGNYIARGEVYSPYWNTVWVLNTNMGSSDVTGTSLVYIEAWYSVLYYGYCNNFAAYTTSSAAVYSTSISTTDPLTAGTSWSSCSGYYTPPYSMSQTGSCSQTVDYSGA